MAPPRSAQPATLCRCPSQNGRRPCQPPATLTQTSSTTRITLTIFGEAIFTFPTRFPSHMQLYLPMVSSADVFLCPLPSMCWCARACIVDTGVQADGPKNDSGIQVKWRALLKLSRPLEQGEVEQRFCGSSSEAFSASASGSAHPCFPADCPEAAPRRSSPTVFVPSQGRAFATIVEALKHARSGDVITLQPGSYAQNSPIVLEHDGVTIVAARYDEIKQGVARPAQVIIISHTHGQDSVVCRARACEVRGIVFEHFSCSPRSGDAHSKSDTPPHLNGCIKIESGDVHIVHCSITSQSGYGIKVSLPRPFHQMPILSEFALICGTPHAPLIL